MLYINRYIFNYTNYLITCFNTNVLIILYNLIVFSIIDLKYKNVIIKGMYIIKIIYFFIKNIKNNNLYIKKKKKKITIII